MRKSVKWMVLLAGILIAASAVEASERRSERSRSLDGPKIELGSPSNQFTAVDFDAPPPAPGIGGSMPPAPMPATLHPVPEAGPPAVGGTPVPVPAGANLYPCVKYHHERKIAPCAVPMVVAVRDPCAKKDPCGCCEPPKCVMVQICVPPCGCPKVRCKADGAIVRYDYGHYVVSIVSHHGVVSVVYN